MARRRRRRKSKDNENLFLFIGVLFLVSAVLIWIKPFITAHATTLLAAAAVLLALVALGGVLTIRARLHRAAQQAELDRNIAVTDTMTGPEFEQYIARLMRRDGLLRVQICGGAGDLGADITAYTPDGRKIVVQCKRYAGSLGDPHIQKFNGTARPIHRADIAALVTTGRPTTRARQLAHRCNIIMIDRNDLAHWATHSLLPIPLQRTK